MSFSLAGINRASGRFETRAPAAVRSLLGVDEVFASLAADIARLKADQLRLARGVADDFSSTDGVDLSASISEVYDGTNKRFTRIATTNVSRPNFASTTASGWTVAVSNEFNNTTLAGWRAVDDVSVTSSYWLSMNAHAPWTITLTSPDAFQMATYTMDMFTQSEPNYGPKAWTLQARNGTDAWTTIDTRSGQNISTAQTYTVASPGLYTQYRLVITSGGSQGIILGDWRFTGTLTPPPNLSVRSIAYTALASPANGYIRVKATALAGSITPGTNLRAWASRDDGATWIEATLTYLGEFEGGRNYHGDIAFTGASGTSMRWRVDATTDGGASIAIDDVTLLWSE